MCETYKFSEKNPIDSFNCNQGFSHLVLGNNDQASNGVGSNSEESINGDGEAVRSVRIPYDLTPSLKISAVLTELGLMPSSSVAVILREFKKFDFTGVTPIGE